MNFYNTLAEWIDAGKPYHSLVCCDCMDAMKYIERKQIDLAIVDPPYNVGASDGRFGGQLKKPSKVSRKLNAKHYSDHDKTPNKFYFNELFRVSVNQIIWGSNYYPEFLYHSGAIVWDKLTTGPLSDCEIAFHSFNKLVYKYTHAWTGFNKGGDISIRIHPNQKPRKLYAWILLKFANDCETILDTHAGSCSSCIEFEINGYKWLAFEKDKDYFEDAKARMKRELAQQRLDFEGI